MAFQSHPDLPASLYKYTTANTALLILQNGTLQVSRPTVFNDLFDMNINLGIEVGNEPAVVEQILDQLWEGLYGSGPLQDRNSLGRGIALMRQFFTDPKNPEEWRNDMRTGIAEGVHNRHAIAQDLSAKLAEQCAIFKILCLSDSGTIAPMWGTYADTLQGVVLQFTPKTEESFFRAALPVRYEGPPIVLNEQQYVDWRSGRLALDDIDLFSMFVFTKDHAWSYEHEWRIFFGAGHKPDADREYEDFAPEDLETVIFGNRIDADIQGKIAALVADRYKACRLRRVVKPVAGAAYVIEDI
ncbi:DUF2971 domain-containing protein [Mesorhizobium sp. M1060]|uniref:DUF2971 domain-containing protein n=1 Tax=Mesorhizobium sp. M1060 TaxID=2957052 RepID=UPI00333CAC29